MIREILKYIQLKNVEVLLYKSGEVVQENISFEPYGVSKNQIDYRKTEYQVLHDNIIVHSSTVFSFSPTLNHLKCKGILIGNCYTNPEYRGKSIYSKMLQYIVKKNVKRNSDYFVFVHPENKASIAGIEKAGFKKVLLFKAKKRMHFFYNEEITRFSSETDTNNLHI